MVKEAVCVLLSLILPFLLPPSESMVVRRRNEDGFWMEETEERQERKKTQYPQDAVPVSLLLSLCRQKLSHSNISTILDFFIS